jgi:hypothetical protein
MAIRHAEPVVAFEAVNAGALTVDHLSVAITRTEPPEGTANHCVDLDGCGGVIKELTIGWPAATGAWVPVLITAPDQCESDIGETPLAMRALTVTPPVERPALVARAR